MLLLKKISLVAVITINFVACKKVESLQESTLDSSKKQTLYSISYGNDSRNVMDIALPKNRTTNTPVVIFIHGGAWVIGDKSVFLKEIDQFADAGIACATINYRYASDLKNVRHNELMYDVKIVIEFIASKTDKWQIAPNRFGLVGQSAGGHLSMMAAYTQNQDNKIKACASWAGPVNFIDNEQLSITGSHEVFKIYVGHKLENSHDTTLYKIASPFWNVIGNAVPTLLIHGTKDIGVPYNNISAFKTKLDEVGINNSFVTFNGEGHLWFGDKLNEARAMTLQWFQEKL